MWKNLDPTSTRSIPEQVQVTENERRLRELYSLIKNKRKKSELYNKHDTSKRKLLRSGKIKLRALRREFGEEKYPRQEPQTLENTRVPDETIVDKDDLEVKRDFETDELSTYFKGDFPPKVLITTRYKCSKNSYRFARELQNCIPNSVAMPRRVLRLKKIIKELIELKFTCLIVLNEDRNIPNGILFTHLPSGPTAYFKLSSLRRGQSIKHHGRSTPHYPELILNNFTTRIGHTIGRIFAAIFPQKPDFTGRQAVTFHTQRDYIFFRRHRYIFRNKKKVSLQELGPRFTLRLQWIQKGTFDTKYGEYLWLYHRKTMGTNKRKFIL
ncbi:Brix domain containing protein [Oopsacas minuta]|uniref:Brix domain containing protein n=1 Tax=Oopsacas minuta TaxID=111878 RepID=A0AAV7JEL6_9METZ|nr:Brix domain containing protein [Oopsacas minuta]